MCMHSDPVLLPYTIRWHSSRFYVLTTHMHTTYYYRTDVAKFTKPAAASCITMPPLSLLSSPHYRFYHLPFHFLIGPFTSSHRRLCYCLLWVPALTLQQTWCLLAAYVHTFPHSSSNAFDLCVVLSNGFFFFVSNYSYSQIRLSSIPPLPTSTFSYFSTLPPFQVTWNNTSCGGQVLFLCVSSCEWVRRDKLEQDVRSSLWSLGTSTP